MIPNIRVEAAHCAFLVILSSILFFPISLEATPSLATDPILLVVSGKSLTVDKLEESNWASYSETVLPDTTVTLWAKLSFVPTTPETVIQLTGYLKEFTVFYFEDGVWKEIKSTEKNNIVRPMVSELIVRLNTNSNQRKTAYIKTATRYVVPDFEVFTNKGFQTKSDNELILVTLIIGFLICIALLNLFYFFIDKNISYLFYAAYVFFLFLPAGSGLLFSVLDLSAAFAINYSYWITSIANVFVTLFGVLYAYHFLELKKHDSLTKFLLRYFMLIAFVFLFNTIFQWIGQSQFVHTITLLTFSVSAAVGFILWKRGSNSALLFSIAYLVFSLFYFLKLASTYGFIPFNNFYFLDGALIEAMILSYALGRKIAKEKIANKIRLQDSIDELAKQNAQVEQYSHMVAHNLRAPVARLLGLSRIFKQTTNTDPIREELIEKIEKSATDFDLIIKDISLMLEVKKGLRFSMENIQLFHEIQNSILFLDEEVKEVKARITVDVDKRHQVFAMRPYVKSIFTNLLSNSIKYRQLDKDLEIKISSAVMVDKIRITVSDNGLGIDLIQNKDKIFEPFKRFHTHREGRGLGLHLVKAEIEAMGGEIGVESALGKGTTFTIFLQHPKT